MYTDNLDRIQVEIKKSKRKVTLFSWIRLLVFLLIALDVYCLFTYEPKVVFILFLIGLVTAFLYTIWHHQELKYHHLTLNKLIEINENEISIFNGKPSFLHDGNEFHQSDSYSMDLDIFGNRSLFHIINRCFSTEGLKALAESLLITGKNKNDIAERQESISECMGFMDLGQEILAHGLNSADYDKGNSFSHKTVLSDSIRKKMTIIRWLPPLLAIVFLILYFVSGNSSFLLYGFLLNLGISGIFLKHTNKVIILTTNELKRLEKLHRSIAAITSHQYRSHEMIDISDQLQTGLRELKKLKRKIDLLESRNNLIIGMLFNGVFGFDLHAVLNLDRWYIKNGNDISKWEKALASAEVIFSYATFARNNPQYKFPVFDGNGTISGKNIRHPFISEGENIGNDFYMHPDFKVMLVTGSNMSGKSTFLRSVGINQILASAGSVVAADTFNTDFFNIYTSFRKSDSIQESTSLFYDELKRLKMIFNNLDQSRIPALVLLDEILRGTNSDDKYYGSYQILLKLKERNALTVLATHDLNLSKLENEYGPIIQNFSFESIIRDGDLIFDYKIKKGVAKNKNATFLMEKMGII